MLRPGDVAATRRALADWGVTGAVLPDQPGLAAYDRVTSVPYTVAFLTAVTGRAPTRRAGSWVWSGIAAGLPAGPGPTSGGGGRLHGARRDRDTGRRGAGGGLRPGRGMTGGDW